MTCTCPQCGHEFDPDVPVRNGERVNLRDAARLLGISYGTFRNWRSTRDIPRGEWIDGEITYTLADIERIRMTSE